MNCVEHWLALSTLTNQLLLVSVVNLCKSNLPVRSNVCFTTKKAAQIIEESKNAGIKHVTFKPDYLNCQSMKLMCGFVDKSWGLP